MRLRTRRRVDRWGALLTWAAGILAALAIAVLLGVLAVHMANHVTAFVVVAVIVVIVLGAAGVGLRLAARAVPRRTVVELDLARPLVERASDPIGRLGGPRRQPTLRDVVEALERAAADGRVAGLVARIGTPARGLAHAQELRDAVASFRARGKWAVAWAESFGESGPGTLGYYLASAFDEIALQPSGDVGLTGIVGESVFVREAFDKIGIEPRIDRRQEFKNAANIFTERSFTPPHREAVSRIVESCYGQIVKGIASGRGLAEDEVRALVDRGPLYGAEAVEARLVDRLGYRDEVVNAVKARAGSGAELLALGVYARRARRRGHGARVAFVHGTGPIRAGSSGGFDPLSGTSSMGSDTVSAAFRAAAADPHVRAILFRIDSPGGSYVASDTIWRETVLARGAGKPVIVSMGNVAGSGGYFVAMDADKIVAVTGTLTGSIGVFGGKAVVSGLRTRLGITSDEVHAGSNATMWSTNHDYTQAGWERVQASLDRCYADFTGKVAEGRGMPLETVQRIARGRIWTGEDAHELGLVDELGGLGAAMRLVRAAIGEAPDAPLRLHEYPRPPSLLKRLRGARPQSSDDVDAVRMHESALAAGAAALTGAGGPGVDTVRQVAAGLGVLGDGGLLEMPDVGLRWG